MSSDAFRLPVRPRPLPDESFASWVQRTAFSNGLRTSDLYPAKPNVNKALGLPPKAFMTENLTHLSLVLGMDEHLLEDPMQAEHVDATTAICPLCLLDSPYFRVSWQFPHTIRCEQHKIHLLDHCTFCNNHIPAYVAFKERMHPQDMLQAFVGCRKCGKPLHTCEAEPDREPAVHWHLYALLNGFHLEPPFPWLTVELSGREWPVGVLQVLYHQVVCAYTFHGNDLPNALWEGHPDFPQENPLGEYSSAKRAAMARIRLLSWFVQDWPWRVHRFLRHVAYASQPETRDRRYWVSEVLVDFALGHDPIEKFHLEYLQETLRREWNRRHEDFHDHLEDWFFPAPIRRLMTHLRIWSLEELPVVNVEDCVCATRWKELQFNRRYKQRQTESE
ncbi:TniQ family protein [Deinococcus cellulosilyticus]|uniref:TniQ domain-containing protein n=1 Tax=Deinococcus cellulosilyticus (strain DSM 18568 / NBRC 106333 / KACC 11606 / 5516J-15) TaxID=1223518 RepID=A0A511N1G9_DEIC1|nr:TniQ family protein [Deinococcus cellulosilyticus]GEM46712.1 hypothetical protein DC3_23470 [Deinococcus cellulosilyticus NBRC 106333 = KACC 11606]